MAHLSFQKDLKCEGCIDLVKLLDTFLEKNASRDEINSTIYKLCDLLSASERLLVRFEPPRGKTNNVVSEQVGHKPACTATEAG